MKSRTLAGKLADAGKVRVNGNKINSASAQIKIDDVLTITMERQILVLKILAFGERRGPYVEAKELYEDLSPPVIKQSKDASLDIQAPKRDQGLGRPTKKDRRLMDRFRAQSH